jgi:hypothetical protein
MRPPRSRIWGRWPPMNPPTWLDERGQRRHAGLCLLGLPRNAFRLATFPTPEKRPAARTEERAEVTTRSTSSSPLDDGWWPRYSRWTRPGSRSEAPLAQEASAMRTQLLSVLVSVLVVVSATPIFDHQRLVLQAGRHE